MFVSALVRLMLYSYDSILTIVSICFCKWNIIYAFLIQTSRGIQGEASVIQSMTRRGACFITGGDLHLSVWTINRNERSVSSVDVAMAKLKRNILCLDTNERDEVSHDLHYVFISLILVVNEFEGSNTLEFRFFILSILWVIYLVLNNLYPLFIVDSSRCSVSICSESIKLFCLRQFWLHRNIVLLFINSKKF